MRIWSHKTGSTASSHVSPLILHIQTESGASMISILSVPHIIVIIIVSATYQKWVWEKRGAHKLVHDDTWEGSTRYSNYLEDYWLCAGGLSAVNAIGAQRRDLVSSGTEPMAIGGIPGN